MNDRYALAAIGGAVLGIAGAAGSVAGVTVAGVVAGMGAVIAATAAVSCARRAGADDIDSDGAPEVLPPILPPGAEAPTASVMSRRIGPTADETARPVTTPWPGPPSGAAGDPTSLASNASLLTDPATGLFSEDYFNVAVGVRVAAARRHLRPVGVAVLEVVEGVRLDQIETVDPVRVARAITMTLRDADTACHRADGRFALLLEDTAEDGSVWTVERIRRSLTEQAPGATMWAGIACYPAHGLNATSLITQAETALAAAREWHQDRIEVAVDD